MISAYKYIKAIANRSQRRDDSPSHKQPKKTSKGERETEKFKKNKTSESFFKQGLKGSQTNRLEIQREQVIPLHPRLLSIIALSEEL